MTLILLALLVCFVAYANGANDNFKGVATIYGSGTASYRVAIAWATVSTAAGSVASIFLAEALLRKFSGRGLVPDSLVVSEYFLLAVTAGAGTTVLLAARLGFPISTTHALLGALGGAGCVAVGPAAINFGSLGRSFVVPLLLSPVVALLLGATLTAIFRFMRRPLRRAGEFCLCLVPRAPLRLAPVRVPALGRSAAAAEGTSLGSSAMMLGFAPPAVPAQVPNVEVCTRPDPAAVVSVRASKLLDAAHFLSAGVVSFARGLNDTPKIAAPLILLHWLAPTSRMTLVAVAIAVGGLLGARRVAETMSHKITRMDPGQGFASNLTTSVLVILASTFGLPVSTTHVSVGSLFGIGLVTGGANAKTAMSIVLSWVVTLPCAACIGGLAYLVAETLR